MITLDDFVQQTLTQIARGVSAFEEAHKESGITARPSMYMKGELAGKSTSEAGLLYLGHEEGYASLVNFDVAITEEDSEAAKAGAGIKVWFANAGGDIEAVKGNSAVNRIQFTIPLKLKE